MGLILPRGMGPSWGGFSHNMGTMATTMPGTTITGSGTAHVKGSVSQLLSALTHDVDLVWIGLSNGNSSAIDVGILVDIVIDPAGGTAWDTTNPLIPNLLGSFVTNRAGGTAGPQKNYVFPLFIPKGASVGARCQSSAISRTINVNILCHGLNTNPGAFWRGTRVVATGPNTGTSEGTDHTAGNTNAFSTWTNFGSTLGSAAGALQLGIGGSDAGSTAIGYEFQAGVASQPLTSRYLSMASTEQNQMSMDVPVFAALPSGTQLQVRGRASGTAEAIALAIYTVH